MNKKGFFFYAVDGTCSTSLHAMNKCNHHSREQDGAADVTLQMVLVRDLPPPGIVATILVLYVCVRVCVCVCVCLRVCVVLVRHLPPPSIVATILVLYMCVYVCVYVCVCVCVCGTCSTPPTSRHHRYDPYHVCVCVYTGALTKVL